MAPRLKFPKPEKRATSKRREQRVQRQERARVRAHVFEREGGVCRCCGFRRATSMHELVFRSRGGDVSIDNSIAVCGDGVRGCHGFLQRHEITYRRDHQRTAEGWLAFRTRTKSAADYTAIWLECERVSDATKRAESEPSYRAPRTPIERLIDEACGYKP